MIATAVLLVALTAAPSAQCAPGAGGDACRAAGVDPALREQLALLLGAIDRPVAAEAWRRLPPGALGALEALANDPGALNIFRARALEGIAALGGDGALHQRLAEDARVPYPVRFAAIRAMGRVLEPPARQRALTRMLTRDPDIRIRAAAAGTLSEALPGTGCADVLAQAGREGQNARLAFRHAVAACGKR